jgi:uncharacterized membrane protein YvlD (DUF360 family)
MTNPSHFRRILAVCCIAALVVAFVAPGVATVPLAALVAGFWSVTITASHVFLPDHFEQIRSHEIAKPASAPRPPPSH